MKRTMNVLKAALLGNAGTGLFFDKWQVTFWKKLPRGQKCPHQYLPFPVRANITGDSIHITATTPSTGKKKAAIRYAISIKNPYFRYIFAIIITILSFTPGHPGE